MKDAVDYLGIFETLPEPIAVCDEDGNIVAINRQGRSYLAVESGSGLRIDLHTRETVRQIRMTNAASPEFFLADVGVHGARRTRVSASFHPLAPGQGYRVLFSAGPDGRAVSPNIRMLEALVNVGRHLELFKSADKTIALFAASFVEIFPSYSFRIELANGAGLHDHRGWEGATPAEFADEGRAERALFSGARRGWRAPIGDVGTLTVERADETKFGVGERQAFETFAQQLGLALTRVLTSDASSSDSIQVGPIIDQLDAIVLVCDARRRVLVSNRTFETMVGTTEIVGRDLLEFFDEPEQARLRTSAASVMAGGEPETFDAHLRTAAHGRVALRVQLAPARSRDGGNGASGFVVTGQQSELSLMELEERMTRAEQLMNLGELATGVAHELKNPLTSIMNYAEYLLAKYQPTKEMPSAFDDRDAERLQRIIAGVAQIDEFVKDLVTLARPNEGQVAPVNLHSVIHESVMMCEVALAHANTVVRLELDERQPIVPGFRNQLKQVFVNLVANAGKSMPADGGVVVVRTELHDGEVRCEVIDNGAGMSPETLGRIFEPFFTTRRTRGGSGLGLALVQTIVHRHGGRIEVESALGIGTTFMFALPVVAD